MRNPKPLRVKIRNALWTIKFEKPPGTQNLLGRCFQNQRTIYVKPDEHLRGTCIHEMLHAGFPWATEREVSDTEAAISAVIDKLP